MAEKINKIAKVGDLIWIHDFHFLLLPGYLRKLNPDLKIGFFLHIPFPSYEIYRQLPPRKEILQSLLKCNLVGFHDYSYLNHFCKTMLQILGVDSSLLSAEYNGQNINLGVYPVSIDSAKIKRDVESNTTKNHLKQFRRANKNVQIILGVDRLDYIKGLKLKLKSFERLLERHPHLKGKVSLLQFCIPSRTDVDEYIQLKKEVEQLVGSINGRFGYPNYTPVQYFFTSIDQKELMAYYRVSDALLVTSRRDGMNLVALEYIAAQDAANPGVAVLSEFAGATSVLSHCLPINPWDFDDTADNINRALAMPLTERCQRHQFMLDYLKNYTATHWAASFMGALDKSEISGSDKIGAKARNIHKVSDIPAAELKTHKGRPLLILMDYDGTLVPIEDTPDKAILNTHTITELKNIFEHNPLNKFIVVTGRSFAFASTQLKPLAINFASEHGAVFFDTQELRKYDLVRTDQKKWFKIAKKIMMDYASRVPMSLVEPKEYAIAWHYRNSPIEFANYQSHKMHEELEIALSNMPANILQGKKVLEVRSIEASKGLFVKWLLTEYPQYKQSFIVCIGDDQTDEEMFTALPPEALTLRVGNHKTQAKFCLPRQADVIPFLKNLVSKYS